MFLLVWPRATYESGAINVKIRMGMFGLAKKWINKDAKKGESHKRGMGSLHMFRKLQGQVNKATGP